MFSIVGANARYTPSTDIGPSPAVWKDVAPLLAANPAAGIDFFDHFAWFLPDIHWTVDAATSGTALLKTGSGGLVELAAGAATQGQGVQMQLSGAPFIPKDGSIIAMEAYLQSITSPATLQFFAGLAEIDTTVFASNANSTDNHIGFEMNALTQAGTGGTASTLNFYGEKATVRNTATENVGLNVQQLAASTAYKIGFVIYGTSYARVFVNGVDTLDVIPTANIPIVAMTPTFVCIANGTTEPKFVLNWVWVAQYGL